MNQIISCFKKFVIGKTVRILSTRYQNVEGRLEMPVTSSKQTWVVCMENGEREFFIPDELELIESNSEKFIKFLER